MAVFLVEKKKKVREAKIITRTMKGMTILGFFFFFRAVPYECLFFSLKLF